MVQIGLSRSVPLALPVLVQDQPGCGRYEQNVTSGQLAHLSFPYFHVQYDGTSRRPEAMAKPERNEKRIDPTFFSANSSRLLAQLCRLPKPSGVCVWRRAAWKISGLFPLIFSSRSLTSPNRGAYRSTREKRREFQGPFTRPRVVSNATSGHTRLMIRPIGPLRNAWVYTRTMRLPRSGPPAGALGNQLSALRRRQQLRQQQEDIQAGLVDYQALPPYPPRPRPPS